MTKRSSARTAIPTTHYHGAHKQPVEAPAVLRWESTPPTCRAFVHDLMSAPELPGDYQTCDVLVTDLPWQNGYDTFNKRAGVHDNRTYDTFMERVSELVRAANCPTYLVTGRHALRWLPQPDVILPMRLNEDDAIAAGYRPGIEADRSYGVAPEFLHALAQQYDTAGDFCCGYGRTGRFFLRSGKQAVLSDINPQCIGYISEHGNTWMSKAVS